MKALVTGGAGFIGSNIVGRLIADGHDVRVLDDLCTGYRENVPDGVELIVGDVADEAVVRAAIHGVEVVFHQAARRSVIGSVEHPLRTDTANVHGTLAVLDAARLAGARRVVSASSSSVYGGAEQMPTPERAPLIPRSPYAVSKLAGEQYCRVYAELHGLETVSLRYFNIYGPRQRPDSAYAAVIPLFIEALAERRRPVVHGDGGQSRDFTFIDDAVAANIAAATAPAGACSGKAYNVAGGHRYSLLEMLALLGEIQGVVADPDFTAPRAGDVRHSEADISAAAADLRYRPAVSFEQGLARTVDWFRERAAR
ncbi:MAG TPA: NAD-dependent epimerase/dehydratase family protein [Acidimicrobiia bacterium]